MGLIQRMSIFALTAVMCIPAVMLIAQDGNPGPDAEGPRHRDHGNFDPAQFQQRMMESIRSKLAFTNNDEWAAVQPLVQKVMDARRETLAGGNRMGGRFGGGEGNGPAPAGGENRPNPGFKSNPEAEALQKVIDAQAHVDEIKTMLEKYRASRKEKERRLAAVRLAIAELLAVDHDGSLPIVFDDAFAYSDPDRVSTLQRMLDLGASRGLQVIVLSCNPSDYAGLGARSVVLTTKGL